VSAVATPSSPYKGLAAFEDSDLDALLFFGRDRDSQVIAANLMASRLTVLFGPTGVGKTSVLRAGVAYRLRQEMGVEVRIHSTWTGDPADALAGFSPRATDDLYLILDQFEEYFLYHEHDRGFVQELAAVIRGRDLRVNVLIGIREDALAQLDLFKASIPNLLANRLRLNHLDRGAGEDAILGPVGRYNELVDSKRRFEVEPALVSAVLDEVAAGRVELAAAGRGVVSGGADADLIEAPYLQLVMTRLWEVEEERSSTTLRLETLRELGGAAQIVQDHLDHAMAELSPRQKDAAAEMYNFLVTPSGTKIAHDVRDLAGYADLDEAEATDVLRQLAAERIVRASSDDRAATRYEIYHDVLADAVAGWRNRHRSERAVQEAERRRRRALAVATTALIGLVVVAAIAVFALVERSHSRSQARRAHARQLAAAATTDLEANPRRSLGLALQAAELERGPEEERVLRQALLADTQRELLRATGPVRVADFDPRGGRVVTGSKDGKVRVYRLGSTSPVQVLEHDGPVTAAVYGPRRQLLTASRDGTARLWSFQGRLVHRLAAGGPVRSASYGKRGQRVLTLTEDGVIRVWRRVDGKLLRTIHVRGKALPKTGELDPAGELIVTVGHDRFARLYSASTGNFIRSLEHKGRVHCARFNPSGSEIITCGHEGLVREWSRSGHLIGQFGGPEAGQAVLAGTFSPRGLLVAGAVSDGTARLWDARKDEPTAVMFAHFKPVTQIAFSHTGNAIVTGSTDRRARTWLRSGKPVLILAGHTGPINAVAFSPDSRSIVTASEDGTARIWRSGTEPELELYARQISITAFAVSPDGKRVLVGDERGVARVRAVGQARVLASLRVRRPVSAVAFAGETPLVTFLPTASLAVSHDGKRLARGQADGTVVIHAIGAGGGRLLRTGSAAVSAVAFSPDDTSLATGTSDGSLRIWDIRSGRRLRSFVGHKLGITSVAFSPDGSLLLTASLDNEARTWNVATGAPDRVLGFHSGPVGGASFSNDGRWVVTAGGTGANIVNVSTGQRALILHGHSRRLIGASFAGADGWLIVTASKDGTIRRYHCDICGDVEELIALAKRRLGST
jgi:WD40 repeat protein